MSLIAFLVLINSGGAKFILDSALGFSWSSPIINFLERNSQGFLVVFLMALFWDYFYKGSSEKDDKTSHEISRMMNMLEQYEIKHIDAGKILEEKIQDHYGIRTNVSNLVDIVITNKKIHTDVNVSYKLSNSDTAEKYSLRYQYEFSSSDCTFYIAFLTSSDLQDQLTASTDLFFDMFVFSDTEGLDENVRRMHKDGFYIKAITKNDGTTVEVKAKFKKIPEASYSQLLPSWFNKSTDDILIYKASFSPQKENSVKYVYSQVYSMDISDNYCYWVSDRTLFLEKIKIDLESFLDSSADFTFQPFLANSVRTDTLRIRGQDIYELNVHNWVVKGQGVLIIWRK